MATPVKDKDAHPKEEKDAPVPGEETPYVVANKDRKCTDILCLILFIVVWIGMFVVAGVSLAYGNPRKLFYGTDFSGRTCGDKGSDFDFTTKKYIYYPRLQEDILLAQRTNLDTIAFYGVCVEQCPGAGSVIAAVKQDGTEDRNSGSPWNVPLNTTSVMYRCLPYDQTNSTTWIRCIDPCPTGPNAALQYCGADESTNAFEPCGSSCDNWVTRKAPMCKTVETRQLITTKQSAKSNPVYEKLNQGAQLVTRWIGDMLKAGIPILVCGGGVALILGFIWVILLQFCAGVMVWLTILLLLAILILLTAYFAYFGKMFDLESIQQIASQANVAIDLQALNDGMDNVNVLKQQQVADQEKYYRFATYIMIAIDAVLFIAFIVLRSRIGIATGIIREAAKCIRAIPMIIFFPIIPAISAIVLTVYFLYIASYIATSGTITPVNIQAAVQSHASQFTDVNVTIPAELQQYNDSNVMKYLLIFHLFGFLWANQLIQSICFTTIAGAVCTWYWTRNKANIGYFPLLNSFWRCFRFHLGTLCFGSFLIATVQMARIALEYLDHKSKQAQKGNQVVKVVMCMLKCCMWCFEKVLKFASNNAYVMVAMKGAGFCTAMKESFFLLFSNAARVLTVSVISSFLLLLGKALITCLSTVAMFVMVNTARKQPGKIPNLVTTGLDEIDSPIFPLLLSGLLAYFVSSAFMAIYHMTIDSMLICFCEDCKVNKDSGRYFMSDELLHYIDNTAKKAAFDRYGKDAEAPLPDNKV